VPLSQPGRATPLISLAVKSNLEMQADEGSVSLPLADFVEPLTRNLPGEFRLGILQQGMSMGMGMGVDLRSIQFCNQPVLR
jgi:hypothetical protein